MQTSFEFVMPPDDSSFESLQILVDLCKRDDTTEFITNNIDRFNNSYCLLEICRNQNTGFAAVVGEEFEYFYENKHCLLEMCKNQNTEMVEVIIENFRHFKQYPDCLLAICNNPNTEFVRIFEHNDRYNACLSDECWLALCGKEHTTELIRKYNENQNNIISVRPDFIKEMCKTKNNLCFVETHIDKLTNEHWCILFRNEHATYLIKDWIKNTKLMLKTLCNSTENPEVQSEVESILEF